MLNQNDIATRFRCPCGGTIVRWENRCPSTSKLVCSTCGKETSRTVGELREALRNFAMKNIRAIFNKV